MPGPNELWIVLLIVIVLFGGRKLPELARSVGESIGEFRKATEEQHDGDEAAPTTDET